MNKDKDRKTERQKDRKTERQKDRKTEKQKDRKTERQKDRKTEGLPLYQVSRLTSHLHPTHQNQPCAKNVLENKNWPLSGPCAIFD